MAQGSAQYLLDQSSRVEDYINDRIQTTDDLQTLDDILQSLREQQELQRQQLFEAKDILKQAIKSSTDHDDIIKQKADAFQTQQAEINKRLMSVTQSDTSDEAVKKFESRLDKLQRLEIATKYIEMFTKVESLSEEVSKHIETTPQFAIKAYLRLRYLSSHLQFAQPAAEGAAPHLVDYTQQMADTQRKRLIDRLGSILQEVLTRMKWPEPKLDLPDSLMMEWKTVFELLLDLQEPELLACFARNTTSSMKWEPPILFPFQVMVQPIELRFKYHFSGNRPTNKLDKPEYFLSHTIDQVTVYSQFLFKYVQPIFNQRIEQQSLSSSQSLFWVYCDAISTFLTALFPMVRQKFSSIISAICAHPPLLSHFIHESMKFDSEIRDNWNYTPGPYLDTEWKGLTWEILTHKDIFARWLQVEEEFALSRYQEIIDSPGSGELDYDGVESTSSKPTKVAIRVNDLLETVTERYRPLYSFSQKLRFIIDIQIAIFDQLHERLNAGLEAYLAMTSAIGKTMQMQSSSQASLEGIAGLERLCRIFGSSEYLEKKMQDWSDDVFFVELWTELQRRVAQNKKSNKPVAGPMTISDIAARTSSFASNGDDGFIDGALFDETASAYGRLKERSELILASTLISNAQNSLRPYSRISTWSSLTTTSISATGSSIAPSPELPAVLTELSHELSFLARALAPAPLVLITSRLLLSLQDFFWDGIMMRHEFSNAGASQLAYDIQSVCDVVDIAVGNTESGINSASVMSHLLDGIKLLSLNSEKEATSEIQNSGDALVDSATRSRDSSHSLQEVEKKVYEDNKSCRQILSELELLSLTETDARAILERRVEARH